MHKLRVSDALVWAGLLTDLERERAFRFRLRADRERFVAGRGAMRWLVGQALGADPARLVFGEGRHGKPFVLGDASVHFNVSHSGHWVLVALAEQREVGVDIELARPGVEVMELAPAVFTPREIEQLEALPASLRQAAFLRLWTRKEAVLKAWGVGLSVIEASELHVGLDGDRLVVRSPDAAHPPAIVEDIAVDDAHFAALARLR